VRKKFAARALIFFLCAALLSLLVLTPSGANVSALLVPFLISFP
jgi:dolichol kinase